LKPQSAKAKGRLLQQWVRDKLITLFGLSDEDIRSTSMGAGGEDILFSPVAARRMGISVECKSRDRIAVYGYYEQAQENCPPSREAVVVIKQNRAKPLVVVDAEYYFDLLERSTREQV
jgi:hypothetical protein